MRLLLYQVTFLFFALTAVFSMQALLSLTEYATAVPLLLPYGFSPVFYKLIKLITHALIPAGQ